MEWLRRWGYRYPAKETHLGYEKILYLPNDAGAKRALARWLSHLFLPEGGNAIVLVTLWGVWESAENMPLFDAFRRASGEARPLPAVPGHLVSSSERVEFDCLISLCLYNFWDAVVGDNAGRCLLSLSHDEAADLSAAPEWTSEIDRLVATFDRRSQDSGN